MSLTTLHPAGTSGPDAAAERAHRKLALAVVLRLFAEKGYEFGFNGHITVRDPGPDETFWANPLDVPWAHTKVSDLVRLDREGNIVEGYRDTSIAGFRSQFKYHSARKDAVAVVHAHSPYGFAWSALGRTLPVYNHDGALLSGLVTVRDSFDVPAADTLGDTSRVVVQKSHGFVTVGSSLEEAAFYFIAAERAAHTAVTVESIGGADELDPSEIEKWALTPAGARAQFENDFLRIVAQSPDIEA
ncbi:class II aldolase/adducin family protein [Rhodococcus rhodochrous]|uniref:class II aldolase/adducin family protein n=1 Tax=Rhodococcus rhodochrous TaxID=1829 RepID=UPI001E4EC68C|nr:class II aldolase/adducin family protein [Rhodococcus rhodochrous]MCB8913411.1 class II aldolase/adducin family protein [Rhodococcus rhodochrous]